MSYLPRSMRKAPPAARVSSGLALSALLAACGPAVAPATAPAPVTRTGPVLPPIPLVEGPLAPRLVYPQANQLIQSRDSTFILGSVGNGRASLTVNGLPVSVEANGAFLAFVPNPPPTAPQYELVATLGNDTARVVQPVRVGGMQAQAPDSLRPVTPPLPPPPPPTVVDTTPAWVVLGDSVNVATDTDRVVIGRPEPNETYRWFLMPGTRVQLTARYPGYARVRLDSALDIWVSAADARTFAPDTVTPRRVAGNARVICAAEWCDLVIPMSERPAYFVEEGEHTLDLTLYATRGNTDLVDYPTGDSLIEHVTWAQERGDRARYTLRLSRRPFGYLALWASGAFVLRVRRPPSELPASVRPLAGLTIAVDPGHPPAGATGPTGLYEGDAVLPVAFILKRMLEERGATVVMTRSTRDPIDLAARPAIARRAGAHAFVSLHYNAYGDGVNPFRMPNGIETYFYRSHSEPLARAVQTHLLAQQSLEDQGVHFRSLAVVRSPWFPAILAEGGYIIIPAQENAMRTDAFQARYARGIADGLESYFRALRTR